MASQCKVLFAGVRNQGDHGDETIGIYMDVIPAGGVFTTSSAISADNPFGCAPAGRVIETRITSVSTNNINVFAVDGNLNGAFGDTSVGLDEFITFSCANHSGAAGAKYEILAVVDLHGDDLAKCGPGTLINGTCLGALADDDPSILNNDDQVPKPRVIGP